MILKNICVVNNKHGEFLVTYCCRSLYYRPTIKIMLSHTIQLVGNYEKPVPPVSI